MKIHNVTSATTLLIIALIRMDVTARGLGEKEVTLWSRSIKPK
jgi:hypothetical protein